LDTNNFRFPGSLARPDSSLACDRVRRRPKIAAWSVTCFAAAAGATSGNGGDATIGRKLYRYFLDAGIPRPELRLSQDVGVTGDIKVLMVSTLEASADAIIDAGLAGADEVAAAIADLAAFAADPETVIGGPRTFQLWARR
jgi:hypothetical protein